MNPGADNLTYDPFLMDLERQQSQSTGRVKGTDNRSLNVHEGDRQLRTDLSWSRGVWVGGGRALKIGNEVNRKEEGSGRAVQENVSFL